MAFAETLQSYGQQLVVIMPIMQPATAAAAAANIDAANDEVRRNDDTRQLSTAVELLVSGIASCRLIY